jgi:thioredoxin reductase (NADPH)
MTRPVLVVVDDDSDVLAALQAALARRYGADYQILAERSPDAALQTLVRLRQDDVAVAVIIADQWMPHMTGLDLLAQARQLHPAARRLLLVGVWDRSTNQPMSQAMSLGRLDGWVLKPWEPAEEHLYLPVTEQLTEWIRATGQPGFVAIQIVGQQWTPRSHEIRDLLDRNAIPYQFLPHDSEAGQQLLREHGQDGARLPVLVLFDGRVLVDPTNAEGAAAIGIATRPEAARYDLVVVGAGPAGLSAATYGVSEGLRTLMVEPEARGGQAASSSLIRNYLGFPYEVSGRSLGQRASAQAILFGAELVYARAVGLRPAGQDRVVTLADGSQAVGRAVLVATGAAYRRLQAPGVEELLGAGVFYGAAVSEARAMAGSRVFVVGAGNSAGQAALHLAKYAEQVTLLGESGHVRLPGQGTPGQRRHRRASGHPGHLGWRGRSAGTAHPARRPHRRQRDRPGGGTVHPDRCATADRVAGRDIGTRRARVCPDRSRPVPAWPAAAGVALGPPARLLETSLPGVFAAGDVRHRSIKRVASAVGEGSIAVQLVHDYLGERPPGIRTST